MAKKITEKKKYNIIGDIHGRKCWKELIDDECINVFVGDYFSPYHKELTFEVCLENLKEIIEYKKAHPETILLIGNHDIDHWKLLGKDARISRHDYLHQKEIYDFFEENKSYFQAAYSIENKYLVTHAGVSILWYYRILMEKTLCIKLKAEPTRIWDLSNIDAETALDAFKIKDSAIAKESFNGIPFDKPQDGLVVYFKNKWHIASNGTFARIDNLTPDFIADAINHVFEVYPEEFSFNRNADWNDTYGNSTTQSPMWIRPESLGESNVFKGNKKYNQVVGHTMFEHINGADPKGKKHNPIIFVDCLEYNAESFKFSV